MENIIKKITHISEWRKVSELPSTPSRQLALNEEFSPAGVYQLATKSEIDTIGDELAHKDIAYIGKSANIHDRTYAIRLTANSKTGGTMRHNAGRYIRQNKNINLEDVYVRYLYCDIGEETSIEQYLHQKMQELYGYRFKWKEASAGKDGDYSTATLLVGKLNNEERRNLIRYIQDLIKEDLYQEFMEE